MMQEGKFYLFSAPFFWTFVGRYVRHLNFQEIVIADAMYFTRTGATFDVLCAKGIQRETQHHPLTATLLLADGSEVRGGAIIPAQGPKIPWAAATPWVNK